MEPDYAQRYRELHTRHWWWRARERMVLEILQRERPPNGWGTILDVGCGDGLFFDKLAELGAVEGVEADAAIVSPTGPHRPRIHIQAFDGAFQPGKRYALILMLDVVEHLPDPLAALRHAVHLLEPGGVIVVTVPAFRSLWTTHDVLNHHYTRYTRRSFAAVARAAGLRIDRSAYFFHWIFPAKVLQRLWEAVTRPRPSSPRLPPSWINSSLDRFSRLEWRLLGPLHLPFGSSLLIVTRRAAN